MKKLFISQPMVDKTDAEIKAVRKKAIENAKKLVNDEIEVIDSFLEGAPHDANPLWFLSKSIGLLATADVAYFANGWDEYRGCTMEHILAEKYGIPVIHEEGQKVNIKIIVHEENVLGSTRNPYEALIKWPDC